MIGLVRMYCYRKGVFSLVECMRAEAKTRRIELTKEGWVITHTDFV